MDTKGLNN